MRIGIDARPLLSGNYTGIARCLYENICVWIEKYPEHEYYLFSDKKLELHFDLPSNWHILDEPFIIKSSKLWFSIKLPMMIRSLKLDVYWGSNFILPNRVSGTKYCVTIHDLAIFKFENISNSKKPELFKKRIIQSCLNADKIIGVSYATANDIIEITGVKKEKVCTSYNGGISETKTDFIPNDINPIIQFDEKFFLFISTIEPRKNIITIIKAFERFIDNTNSEMKLILAGKRGWNCDEIYLAVKQSRYSDKIIMPGFISEADKIYLLKNATVFLYPSLYEGFGIPILEAFEYNLPVITSRTSSIPEIGGNAAFYIDDPMDIDGLARHMENIICFDDEKLRSLYRDMEKQLRSFSWEKNACEIMQIFKGV